MTRANLRRLDEGKLYYSISEVCTMTGLEQHVLRYWESEFPQLRPKKNRSGNRAYRAKEIKIIRYIKYLLYEEMFTIPGAKKKMADANMSDMEGQLTLLRVPAGQPPSTQGDPTSITSATNSKSDSLAAGMESNSAAKEDDDLAVSAPTENAEGHKARSEIARLKEQMRSLRDELNRVLNMLTTVKSVSG